MELPPLPKARQRSIVHLHVRRHRDSARCFIAEGVRTLEELLRSSYHATLVVATAEAARRHRALVEQFVNRHVPCYLTDEATFARLADTKTPQGVLAVVAYPDVEPAIPDGSLVVLDGINDPGNAGTIVRTAVWFGYTGVILGSGSVDRYHPKFVRATMGAVFHLSVIEAATLDALRQLRQTHRIIGACSSGGVPLGMLEPHAKPHALVIGSEAHGISPDAKPFLEHCVTIEGRGTFDSLNAAVAAAIVMYHLYRSR